MDTSEHERFLRWYQDLATQFGQTRENVIVLREKIAQRARATEGLHTASDH